MAERHPANTLPNPYDFANPVSKKELFAGRDAELKDILFYLDHATTAARSINLALLGERAAGKTSLLNIIEIECQSRHLIPVRIDLNEGDAQSPLAFWFKLFDSTLDTVVNSRQVGGDDFILGGPNGRTYDTYRTLVSTLIIPDDKLFCPFQFPVHYARAMASGNCDSVVPEQVLRRDLNIIRNEASRLIALLIDECNVLASNRILLEMVRNTFMNLPGYMLVFTGTPTLFPVINEVFSPIVRQFKRIAVSPFADIRETLKAIETPLARAGVTELFDSVPVEVRNSFPSEMWYMFDEQLVDIHDITGGRPYEIQLVCHFMFKRIQQGKAKRMSLTHDVLTDVLKEFSDAGDIAHRPAVKAVLKYSAEQLKSLRVLISARFDVGLIETLRTARITHQCSETVDDLLKARDLFIADGILHDVNGLPRFNGDDFDRIFCKYTARHRHILIDFDESEPGQMIDSYLHSAVLNEMRHSTDKRKRPRIPVVPLYRSHLVGESSIASDALPFVRTSQSDISIRDVFLALPSAFETLHRFCVTRSSTLCNGLELIAVSFRIGKYEWTGSYIQTIEDDSTPTSKTLSSELMDLAQRSACEGAEFEYRTLSVRPCSSSDVASCVGLANTTEHRESAAEVYADCAREAFIRKDSRDLALSHARHAAALGEHLDTTNAGNVAFILLAGGVPEDAMRLLALHSSRDDFAGLARYNFGIALLCCGYLSRSAEVLRSVLASCGDDDQTDVLVMLVPKVVDGHVLLDEIWQVEETEDSPASSLSFPSLVNAAIEVVDALLIDSGKLS